MTLSFVLQRLTAGILVALPVLCLSVNVAADTAGSEPADDVVVARWGLEQLKPLPQTDGQRLEEIEKHFQRADLPGESWRYDRVHVLVNDLKIVDTDQVHYYQARLLQHQHKFNESAQVLSAISPESPMFVSARLMMAQVYTELDYTKSAREACTSIILKQADLAAVCSLAAQPSIGESEQTLLSALLNRYVGNDDEITQGMTAWTLYQKSLGYLATEDYDAIEQAYARWGDTESLSVADLVLLSEAQLRNGHPSKTMTLLESHGHQYYPDDAIIVQLARAEKQLNYNDTIWRDFAEERINQRVQRQDQSYAELIALYFSTLGANAEARDLSWLSNADNAQPESLLVGSGEAF